MKPINAQELSKSYRVFIINFFFLSAFSILCIYLFFISSKFEYQLLEKEVKQTELLLLKRKEINTQFDIILFRFKQLSKYTAINSEEMNNQAIMLEDIQKSNSKIKDIIKTEKSDAGSFKLYKKMTEDVGQMAATQDSLFRTSFQIENLKQQLEVCIKTNQKIIDKIKGIKH